MLLVNFMRQTATKSCLRTVKPLHFAKFEKLYPVIFLVKYAKFFIINVGLQILLTQLLPSLRFLAYQLIAKRAAIYNINIANETDI